MQALITGGAGFIGSHLVAALLAEGWRVRVLDDLSSGRVDHVAPEADLVVGDVTDASAVAGAMRDVDVVFHQAAHRSVARSVETPLASDRANTFGTLTVLESARDAGVRRVVNASSSSVYGDTAVRPTAEDAPLRPMSPYAVSKLAAEQYAALYWRLHGLETVSLRYFNVYGPGQRADSPYAPVIPRFLEALLDGEAVEIHGDGGQRRDFTYIDDVVAANLRAAIAPADAIAGRAVNVGRGEPVSVLDLLEQLERTLGLRAERVHLPARRGEARHTAADLAAATALGFRFPTGLADGLRRTADAWKREARHGRATST
jgi:UDP-glucose 4-epimerase